MSRIVVFGLGPMRWETSTRLFALALRSWHFAHTLARSGHEVLLISIRGQAWEGWPADKITRVERDGVIVWSVSEHLCHERPEWIERQIASFRPDAIVGVNRDPAAIAVNFARDLPLWADVNGDPMAEAQVKAYSIGGDWNLNDWYRKFVPVLLRSDRFSTCSRAQKLALIGQLGMVGRLTAINDGFDFVTPIPNSIDDDELADLGRIERRPRAPGSRFVLLWSGGYNTWTDPDVLFEAVERAMEVAKELSFVSTGGEIPGHHLESYARFEKCVARSRHRRRFELAGWVQTAELPAYYAGAHAAILVDRFCYEGMLGARTRALDWLAAGLPIVATRLSEISIELEEAGVALTAPCGDPGQLKDAILALCRNPVDAHTRGERGRSYARERLRAELQLAPLVEWARRPERAPGAERRAELRWEPSTVLALRQHASLVRSTFAEQGARGTAAAMGRFALRRVRHGAARIADLVGASEAPASALEAPMPDAPPAAPPRFAGFEWRERFAELRSRPRVAVLLLVDESTPPHVLAWTGDQVRTQYYGEWCVVIAETTPLPPELDHAAEALVSSLSQKGHAVERVRAHQVELSRHRTLVASDFVLTLPAGSLLRPDALAELCWTAKQERADLVYADETHVDETNIPLPPQPKPDWSPELLLARPYLGGTWLCASGLFELSFEHIGSWPHDALIYDAALRASERASAVVHIPRVLSQRWAPQHAPEGELVKRAQLGFRCQLDAVREALWRRGEEAEVERGQRPGMLRVRWPAPSGGVSVVVIGSSDKSLVERAVRSIEKTSDGVGRVRVEVAEPRRSSSTHVRLKALTEGSRWVVLVDPRVEAFHGEWLQALLEQVGRSGVAAASPKLLHPNGARAWAGAGAGPASLWLEHAVHDVTELCAACVALPRELVVSAEVPLDLGARAEFLSEQCASMRKAGSRLIFTPFSVLYVHGANGELEASAPKLPGASRRKRIRSSIRS